MKKIITFLFLSFLVQGFTFCQIDSSNAIVSIYPHFPSCKNTKTTNADFLKCTDNAFLNFLTENIEYPEEALKNKKEGEVKINFVINDDGTLRYARKANNWRNPKPIADSFLLKEVLRVINKMPQWIINKSIFNPMYPSFDVYVDFNAGKISIETKRNFGYIRPIEEFKLEAEEYENNKAERRKKREEFFKKQEEMLALDSTYEMEKYFVAPPPEFPRLLGCEGQGKNMFELKECSDQEFKKFIYSNIKYPKKARENNKEGIVIAQFIFDNGTIRHIEIIQDIGDGLGEEVQRVINLMANNKKWTPGRSRGKPTIARFTLPVRFHLQSFEEYRAEQKGLKKRKKIQESEKSEYLIHVKALSTTTVKKIKELKNMPRFPGCEGQGKNIFELKECSENEMLKFIYRNLRYPEKARKEGTEGRVIAQFTVDYVGRVGNVKILRDIGNGCGEEVERLILLMNNMGQKWVPSSSTGKPVKITYTLPVSFRLPSLPQTTEKLESIKDSLKLEEPKEEKIFKVVEDMPRFPGCEGRGKSKKELKECSDAEMLKFIYSNIKYPEQARKNKTEGRVIARFIIESDLTIGNVEILNDIGDGCGEEVIRLIHLMREKGKWTSGKSRGKSPRIYFTIPVSFKL